MKRIKILKLVRRSVECKRDRVEDRGSEWGMSMGDVALKVDSNVLCVDAAETVNNSWSARVSYILLEIRALILPTPHHKI